MTKPNSDLGLNDGDEAYMRAQYPQISEFLIWPELRSEFSRHEDAAKQMKSGSRRRSFVAIALITGASTMSYLATSSVIEPALALYPYLETCFAVFGAISLFLALLCGKGILWGRKRDVWLTERLIAERIRQFFFQFLLANAEAICSTSFSTRQKCLQQRQLILEKALRRMRAPAYRQMVRDDSSLQEGLILEMPEWSESSVDETRYQELLRFWEELRFDWQTKYSTSMLDRRASALPIFGSLADQEYSLNALEFAATLGVVTCQALALFGFILLPDSSQLAPASVLVSSLLAIAIVGLQAYKEGMGLTHDLLRNRAYATYSAKLTRDFKAAGLLKDRRAELHAMKEMETLAYFETREFLNAHSRAQFSL